MPKRAKSATGTSSGLAALAICELLLLALTEMGVLTIAEVNGVLADAAAAKRSASDGSGKAVQTAAADVIERIMFARAAFRK